MQDAYMATLGVKGLKRAHYTEEDFSKTHSHYIGRLLSLRQ